MEFNPQKYHVLFDNIYTMMGFDKMSSPLSQRDFDYAKYFEVLLWFRTTWPVFELRGKRTLIYAKNLKKKNCFDYALGRG